MPRRATKTCDNPSPGSPHPSPEAPDTTFHFPQPNRDPESNWEVDLARNLEEYLLRICSGDLSANDDGVPSVNFAEAALLLQGSVQVYSRKVEYLYTLVLHALEFVSQKRQEKEEDSPNKHEKSEVRSTADEGNEPFLGLDDVPEDPKNSLDDGRNKVDFLNNYVKPPANLVVQEGECLDTSGEAGEFESYLLSTCNFYGDFLLLDPRDAEAVHDFMKATSNIGLEQHASHRGGELKSRMRFSSPAGRSGGSRQRPSSGKKHNIFLNETLAVNLDFDTDYQKDWSGPDIELPPHPSPDFGMEPNIECSDEVSSDDDDPWKPLNPHEPGCLKVKPFKKVTASGRKPFYPTKRSTIVSEFPIAKVDGILSPEFNVALELCHKVQRKSRKPKSSPLYEKLRQSLCLEENEDLHANVDMDDNDCNEYDGGIPDFGSPYDIPGTSNMDKEVPFDKDKHDHNTSHFEESQPFGTDAFELDVDASLEDLCRSHLDSLLASIAETEKQTELATRVSTWKQRIERSLEVQDSHLPFDIHLYGEKVLTSLSSSGGCGSCMSFGDVVEGQERYEISRTFSAMLQLVNNGNIELIKKHPKHQSHCYTVSDSFNIKLINDGRREIEVPSLKKKKRMRSPLRKGCSIARSPAPQLQSRTQNGKLSLKLSKGITDSSSPDRKRRLRSQLIQPVNIQLDE